MLRLKHRLTLPRLMTARQLEFAEIPDDDDELIVAIEQAAHGGDNRWQLTPAPDTNQLEDFWNKVIEDIRADPQWIPIGIDEG